MAHRIVGRLGEDLETSSEKIPLSAAKFVCLGSGLLRNRFDENEKNWRTGTVGIAKLTIERLVFFANFYVCVGDSNEYTYTCTKVGLFKTFGQLPQLLQTLQLDQSIHAIAALSEELFILAASDHLKTMSLVRNQLVQLRETKACDCYDISFVENKLVFVSEHGLGIWNTSGVADPISFIKLPGFTPQSTSKLCTLAENGQGVIYVFSQPRLGGNLVTKLSLTGDILNTYNNLLFRNAGGICASGEGHLFMSFPDEGCIRILASDMSCVVTVIENLTKPMSICYCQETMRLFVHCEDNLESYRYL